MTLKEINELQHRAAEELVSIIREIAETLPPEGWKSGEWNLGKYVKFQEMLGELEQAIKCYWFAHNKGLEGLEELKEKYEARIARLLGAEG